MHLSGGSLQVVAQHHLDEWGLDFETGLTAGLENLRATSLAPFRELAEGVWWGFWDDDFGPSRLLFPDRIRGECRVQGDPVVLLAERRVLLVTGAEDEQGLLAAAHAAEEVARGGRPVGQLPLRLCGDDWEPFLPAANTPSGAKIRLAWMGSRQEAYQEQAGYLQALHQKAGGSGPGVEAYHVFQGRDGIPPFSFCIWLAGADCLLPRTEQILFGLSDEPGGEPKVRAQVSWETAQGIVGELMEAQEELIPERWRVRSFPDKVRLGSLQAASGA
jgi:hypothetical protein